LLHNESNDNTTKIFARLKAYTIHLHHDVHGLKHLHFNTSCHLPSNDHDLLICLQEFNSYVYLIYPIFLWLDAKDWIPTFIARKHG
jgi:hypothetical protein